MKRAGYDVVSLGLGWEVSFGVRGLGSDCKRLGLGLP